MKINLGKVSTASSTIKDLHSIFGKIHYGWRNPKTGKPFKTKEEFGGLKPEDTWRLATPEQTIKAEVGNCYDTVAISRDRLIKAKIPFKLFFIFTEKSEFDGTHWSEGATHTVCLYRLSDKDDWRWLEGSWSPFKKNDWHHSDHKTLVRWIAKAMANSENESVVVNELSSYPKYGCDMTEFESHCRKGTKIVTVRPD